MNLKDLKLAVSELMSEGYWDDDPTQQALDDWADEKMTRDGWFDSVSSRATKEERELLSVMAKTAYKGQYKNVSYEDALSDAASSVGFNLDMLKLKDKEVAEYICSVVTVGADGHWLKLGKGKPENCPSHWGGTKAAPVSSRTDASGGGGIDSAAARDWLRRMEREPRAKAVWDAIKEIYDGERSRGRTISFKDAVEKAEQKTGGFASYIRGDMAKAEAVAKMVFLAENKKRGFGEGEPPDEEIYKKREVVQEVGEVDLETPDVADELSQKTKDQSDATKNQSAAHEQAAEAAKQRQDASKAWKDAKITQVKAIDAAEKAAAEEAKATDAQSKAMDAAQKAADAVEKAQGEKEKYLDVAKQAADQEQEAAKVAQEAAAAEEEAEKAMQTSSDEAAGVEDELSSVQGELGDAIKSDEESQADAEEEKAKEEEEAKDEEEEARQAELEAEKEERNAEREAADEKAAADAEANEKEKEAEGESEEEEEPMTEILKTMVREVIAERKWGDEKEASAPTTQQKLKNAGLTADELRGMVLTTVMRGEEERDKEMIDLLQKMLNSLQSIEYHTTPAKGASSRDRQTQAAAWLNEGVNRQIVRSIPSLVVEARNKGMYMLADDHESFFKWALANSDLTMQEIKNEADAQIADLKAMLRKMDNHVTGKEDSLEKQKLRGEVPGHH